MSDKYKDFASTLGELVDEKQAAYGDSFNKSGEVLKILYPDGVPPSAFVDMLAINRVLDKLFRIATRKDAFGESPWKDIAGYALLAAHRDSLQVETKTQPEQKPVVKERDWVKFQDDLDFSSGKDSFELTKDDVGKVSIMCCVTSTLLAENFEDKWKLSKILLDNLDLRGVEYVGDSVLFEMLSNYKVDLSKNAEFFATKFNSRYGEHLNLHHNFNKVRSITCKETSYQLAWYNPDLSKWEPSEFFRKQVGEPASTSHLDEDDLFEMLDMYVDAWTMDCVRQDYDDDEYEAEDE